MTPAAEKKWLQGAVALACVVPILGGLYGACMGTALLDGDYTLDSHMRYLSGLLLAIGIGFLSTVPHIEQHQGRFRLLTFIVVTGGLCRLAGMLIAGFPGTAMLAALGMELVVTPALCLWQGRVAGRYAALSKNG